MAGYMIFVLGMEQEHDVARSRAQAVAPAVLRASGWAMQSKTVGRNMLMSYRWGRPR